MHGLAGKMTTRDSIFYNAYLLTFLFSDASNNSTQHTLLCVIHFCALHTDLIKVLRRHPKKLFNVRLMFFNPLFCKRFHDPFIETVEVFMTFRPLRFVHLYIPRAPHVPLIVLNGKTGRVDDLM